MTRVLAVAVAMILSAFGAHADQHFERILFPVVITDHPGAFGTLWSTRVEVRNEGTTGIELFTSECYFRCSGQCVITMCNPGAPTAPNSSFAERLDRGEIGPVSNPATVLYAERSKASNVSASLRLFETTRNTVEFGVEIPVVRESELYTTTLSLPDVPIPPAAAGRTHLRLYGVESPTGAARVRVRAHAGDAVTFDQTVDLNPPSFSRGAPLPGEYDEYQPAYLLMLFPSDVANSGSAVRVTVEPLTPGLKFWAMASVTTNVTQHVTIVTPQ